MAGGWPYSNRSPVDIREILACLPTAYEATHLYIRPGHVWATYSFNNLNRPNLGKGSLGGANGVKFGFFAIFVWDTPRRLFKGGTEPMGEYPIKISVGRIYIWA